MFAAKTANLSQSNLAVNPITNHHSKPKKKKKKPATQPVKTQSNQTALSATTGEPNQPQP
jgi:hypothetical protein